MIEKIFRRYRGFIYELRHFILIALIVVNCGLILTAFLLGFSTYSKGQMIDYAFVRFAFLGTEEGYCTISYGLMIWFIIWVLFPYSVTFVGRFRHYNDFVIISSLNKEIKKNYHWHIGMSFLNSLLVFTVSPDIFSAFSYHGIDLRSLPSTFASFSVATIVFAISINIPSRAKKFFRRIIGKILSLRKEPLLNRFPELYTNHHELTVGSLSPLLRPIYDSVNEYDDFSKKFGSLSYASRTRCSQESLEVKKRLAKLLEFDLDKNKIFFVSNTTEAIDTICRSIKPSIIIISDGEFESVKKVCGKHAYKIEVELLDSTDFIDRFACQISESMQNSSNVLAVLSHVVTSTGWILPIESLDEAFEKYRIDRGKLTMIIDGAQAVGNLKSVPLSNMKSYDYYVASAHKFLMSHYSLGLIIGSCSNPKNNSLEKELHYFLSSDESLEGSTINPRSIFALSESLKYFEDDKGVKIGKNLKCLREIFTKEIDKTSDANQQRNKDYWSLAENFGFNCSPAIICLELNSNNPSHREEPYIQRVCKVLAEKHKINVRVYKLNLRTSSQSNERFYLRCCIPYFMDLNEAKTITNKIFQVLDENQ